MKCSYWGIAAMLVLSGCTAEPLSQIALTGPYNPNNTFARAIRGEIKVVKVYETDRVLAFMDRAPNAPGHVLVISKVSQARTLLDMSTQDYEDVMAVVRKVALAEVKAFDLEGFTIIENNGLGQSIPHLHVHIVPRYGRRRLREKTWPVVPLEQLEQTAARIRAAIAQMDAAEQAH